MSISDGLRTAVDFVNMLESGKYDSLLDSILKQAKKDLLDAGVDEDTIDTALEETKMKSKVHLALMDLAKRGG
jgi:fatty acid-binding protein DegV